MAKGWIAAATLCAGCISFQKIQSATCRGGDCNVVIGDAPADACVISQDCDPGQVCVEGACMLAPEGPPAPTSATGTTGPTGVTAIALLDNGATCAANNECASNACVCATSACASRMCAEAQCPPCAAGAVCSRTVTANTQTPLCSGANACDGGGADASHCKVRQGQPCTASDSECVAGYCVYGDSNGATRVCADADCGDCQFSATGAGCANIDGHGTPACAEICAAGACKLANGSTCQAPSECGSGNCSCTDCLCASRKCVQTSCGDCYSQPNVTGGTCAGSVLVKTGTSCYDNAHSCHCDGSCVYTSYTCSCTFAVGCGGTSYTPTCGPGESTGTYGTCPGPCNCRCTSLCTPANYCP